MFLRCESELTILLLRSRKAYVPYLFLMDTCTFSSQSLTISHSISGDEYSSKTNFKIELQEIPVVHTNNKKIAKIFQLLLKLHAS